MASSLGLVVVPVGPDTPWIEVPESDAGEPVGAVVLDVLDDGTALVLLLYER